MESSLQKENMAAGLWIPQMSNKPLPSDSSYQSSRTWPEATANCEVCIWSLALCWPWRLQWILPRMALVDSARHRLPSLHRQMGSDSVKCHGFLAKARVAKSQSPSAISQPLVLPSHRKVHSFSTLQMSFACFAVYYLLLPKDQR